jgi:hypothetical protein
MLLPTDGEHDRGIARNPKSVADTLSSVLGTQANAHRVAASIDHSDA